MSKVEDAKALGGVKTNVIPAKAGIHNFVLMDPGLRWGDIFGSNFILRDYKTIPRPLATEATGGWGRGRLDVLPLNT